MDYEYEACCGMLKMFSSFSDSVEPARFTYDLRNEQIQAVIEQYELRSVTGSGSQLSQALNLMTWLRSSIRYNGMTTVHPAYSSEALLEHAIGNKEHGLNCRMLATVLAELLLGFGIAARIVSLHSSTPYDEDNHVVTILWLQDRGKWVLADPSFDAYYESKENGMLNPWELRQALADGRAITCRAGALFGGEQEESEDRLLGYMAKNLFCMHSPLINTFGSETPLIPNQRWICLSPLGYDYRRRELLNMYWRLRFMETKTEISDDIKALIERRKERLVSGAFVYINSLHEFSGSPSIGV